MSTQSRSTNWFSRLVNNGIGLLVLVVLMMIVFVAGAWYLDSRIQDLDTRSGNDPPRTFQPADPADYDSGNVTADALGNAHMVYVPVYSHTYFDGGRPYSLETTLSVRNVSVSQPIYLDSVRYFDTEGNFVSSKLDRMIKLRPLQTIEFLVKRRDSTGGSGANFLVRWYSETDVDAPIIEALMVGTTGTQGISFSRRGVEITAQ